MSDDRGIVIKNVYHMLAYSFRALRADQYRDVEKESFNHVHDLFAAILAKGVAQQLKRGLHREYVVRADNLPTLRGKLDLVETAKLQVDQRQELACEFDELSSDNLFNQILKAALVLLIRHGEVKREHKDALKKIALFLTDVTDIDLVAVDWSTIRFTRHNQSYRLLLGISRLLAEGMLLTTSSGEHRLMGFIDDQEMFRLYEAFLLAYYRKHWPQLRPRAAHIPWALNEGERGPLPTMRSDLVLTDGRNALVIDAKYYKNNMSLHHGRYGAHSANLYQIFTYVKNRQAEGPEEKVAGLLLYAQTNHAVQPDASWVIDNNQIMLRTLDLARDFASIERQLDLLVTDYFDIAAEFRAA